MFKNITFLFSDDNIENKVTDFFTKSKDHLLAIPAFSELLERSTREGVVKIHFTENPDQEERLDGVIYTEFEDDMHDTISAFISILCCKQGNNYQIMTQEEKDRSEFEDSKLGFYIMAGLNKTELKEYLGLEDDITHLSFEEFMRQKDSGEEDLCESLGELSLCSE